MPAHVIVASASSAATYVIDAPCSQCDRWAEWASDGPCVIVQLDHYGQPTPHLFCTTHTRAVGHVR